MCYGALGQCDTEIFVHYVYRVGEMRHKTVCHGIIIYAELHIILAEVKFSIGIAVAD